MLGINDGYFNGISLRYKCETVQKDLEACLRAYFAADEQAKCKSIVPECVAITSLHVASDF